MEHPEDFVVIEEEPIGSTEQALNRLYLLIDLFSKSTDAVNQSNILLKDELQLALDVTLQNIKPEEAPNCADLINAFEAKLTGTEDTRRTYMKHLLSRLVSVNNENQGYQCEIADLKQTLDTGTDLFTQKINDAFSSLKSIQTMLTKFETSSSLGDVTLDGAATATPDNTDHEVPNEDHTIGDDHNDKTCDNVELGDPIKHTLDDLCKGLSEMQLRIANLSMVSGSPFNVNTGRETQCTSNIETSSFFTVDEDMLSRRSANLLSPDTNTVVPNSEIDVPPTPVKVAPTSSGNQQSSARSPPDGDSSERKSSVAAPILVASVAAGQTMETAVNPCSKSIHTCTEVQTTVATSEAACQWADTPPTRLISGGEPLPDTSNSNRADTLPTRLISGGEPLLDTWNSNNVTRDHFINNQVPEREPGAAARQETLPNYSAEQEDPWCPCCCQRFASREELEDHLLGCLT